MAYDASKLSVGSLSGLALNTSRTITTMGSVFLFLNNTIGPGLALLPALYQEAGWLLCVSCIVVLSVMSYGVGRMLTFSIRRIPHNQDDDLKIEYLDLIKYYVGFSGGGAREWLMRFCQSMYLLFMVSFLISSIIQTSQTLDLAIDRAFGHSVGVVFFPADRVGIVHGHCLESISPFCDDSVYVLSVGTVAIYALIIPFCLKDLQEAIWIQYLGSYGTILLLASWCFMLSFSAEFEASNVPAVAPGIWNVLSVNIFNVAFICTFPSWLNEKRERVSPQRVLQCVALGTSATFVLVGLVGGMAFAPYFATTGDLLSKLNHFRAAESISSPTLIALFETLGPVSCYLYPILQCLSGIPVFCTVVRYNLINTHILRSKWAANTVAIVLPFSASVVLYHGNGFNAMLNWTGSVFSSFVNFILPIFFYYRAVLRPQADWERIARSDHHLALLRRCKINVHSAPNVDTGDHRKTAYSQCLGSHSPLEIVERGDSKTDTRSVESDGLLFGIPRSYNSVFAAPDRAYGDDIDRVIRGHAEKKAARRARKALCFLALTLLMALTSFGMDIVPYFI